MATARAEAKAAFGNGELYLEKYLARPRHIEMQMLADKHGNVVHLGERDCSLQRRHQKVLEEAPSPALDTRARARIGRLAAQAVAQLGYRSVGTVEFLYEDGEFYFIEMNTRLQVEHPMTEMVSGLDLVREKMRIAAGAPLGFGQQRHPLPRSCHRVPDQRREPGDLRALAGRIADYHAPGGLGVRVDSALYAGYRVPPYYDSLIAKLIVHGPTATNA